MDNLREKRELYNGFGNARLDLSQVDFTGQDKHIVVRLNAGDLRVVVPPKVDVEVSAKVGAGNANVFDSSWDGVNTPRRTVVNTDTDGPGGGPNDLSICHTNAIPAFQQSARSRWQWAKTGWTKGC